MSGVRLSHPTARSGMLTVELRTRPYEYPFLCPQCAKAHLVKTYHLVFDAEGYTIVSPQIVERLKEIEVGPGLHFVPDVIQYADDVNNPPAQQINFGVPTAGYRIERHRVGDAELDDGPEPLFPGPSPQPPEGT